MSSFFTAPASKKRKRTATNDAPKKRAAPQKSTPADAKSRPRKPPRDESISGSDDESDDGARDLPGDEEDASGSEGEGETAAERRLRMAEEYVKKVRGEIEEEVGFDAEEIDRDLIAERLQEDVAESKGRAYRQLAPELDFAASSHTMFRNDSEAITSVAICLPYAYTVSKDVLLTKWRLQDLPKDQYPQKKGKRSRKKKQKQQKPAPPPKRRPEGIACARGDVRKAKDNSYRGHTAAILCVAASQDGKFVVTGGRDRRVIVWDAETLTILRVWAHHRDAVTGLAFRRGKNQLYSSSADRTIKVWSLDELAYVETLFGHQDQVVDVAALSQERCISVGARDRTARLWKVVEETQLVFRGGGAEKKNKNNAGQPRVLEGSMDRVAMIDEETFVTGGDNGSISLWVIHKKKPIFTLSLAHGVDPPLKPDEASANVNPDPAVVPQPQPRWITALTTIPYSDVILSGSWDGQVRAWKVSDDKKKIEPMGAVGVVPSANADQEGEAPSAIVRGVVNDLDVVERGERGLDGTCIVAAVGKQHRLGEWMKIAGKNSAVVFEVPRVVKPKVNGLPNGVHHEDDKE